MKPLTPTQRRALRMSASKGGVKLTPPFCKVPRDQASAASARVLAAQGFVTVTATGVALITRTGRKAMNAVLPEDAPVFLKEGHGLTSGPRAVYEAGEVIDPATLKGFWSQEAASALDRARDVRAARDATARLKARGKAA